MNDYLFPIKQAIITFPFIALVLTAPFLIVQYRKYGYVNKLRSVVLYSLLLYLLSAYYLVILPLPADFSNCLREGSLWSYMQTKPFTFINDIKKEAVITWSSPASYIYLLKERSFLQALFNVVLTLPLGVYLRYYFRRGWMSTLLISLLVSIFFETTQLTGLYGIYECPYRLFDVDDLMLNTLGGMIGFVVAPILTYFLPRADKLDEHIDLEKMTVGFIRRGISFVIDTTVLGMLASIVGLVLYGADTMTLGYIDRNMDATSFRLVALAISVFLYFVVIAAITNGRTLGKWITRIHVIEDARRSSKPSITWLALLKRYGMLYYGVFGLNCMLAIIYTYGELPYSTSLILVIVHLVLIAVMGVHVVLCLFSRDKRLFYERISGTRNVVTLHTDKEDEGLKGERKAANEMEQISADETVTTSAPIMEPVNVPKPERALIGNRNDSNLMQVTAKANVVHSDHVTASTKPEQLANLSTVDQVDLELERLRAKLRREQIQTKLPAEQDE
ncbi:VanZ family protein [Paenibacillus sp. ACRRX]|uniref:VanZ family protein n=1 Tax=Paenibacillus sp. ACRRX TaxID=2918206 RepID=UPI001EF6C0F9|nr:VanZ family protein [Paenibacillus sp. ACRRX]MCG7406328.1 VanZ family protein [Paenibacillus sp. ACRRX]